MIEVEELFALAFIFTIFVAFQGLFIFVIFVLLSKQVKESYAKWWKAKVAESDFLSKHFGDKSIAASTLVNLLLRASTNLQNYILILIFMFPSFGRLPDAVLLQYHSPSLVLRRNPVRQQLVRSLNSLKVVKTSLQIPT